MQPKYSVAFNSSSNNNSVNQNFDAADDPSLPMVELAFGSTYSNIIAAVAITFASPNSVFAGNAIAAFTISFVSPEM